MLMLREYGVDTHCPQQIGDDEDWSEETKFSDHLSVGIESREFSKWLNDD